MKIRSPLFFLLAAVACNQAPALEDCPAGSVLVGRRCLVACASDLDCLSSEQCDPAVNACRPTGGDGDAEIRDQQGPDDAIEPRDGGPLEADVSDIDRPPPIDGGQRADFTVHARSTPPGALLIGQEVFFEYAIANEGSELAPQTTAELYLNPPGEIMPGPSTIPLDNRTVPPTSAGGEHRFSKRWSVPQDLPGGRYALVGAADTSQRVLELDETNNIVILAEIDIIAVSATPNPVDFGSVHLGCDARRESVTLTNEGNAAVGIAGLALSPSTSTEYRLEMVPGTPNLGPNESLTLVVQYEPIDPGVDLGTIDVQLDSGVAINIALRGEGDANNAVNVHFVQSTTRRADILFVMDDSCSMSEEQTALGFYANGFLNALDQRGIDYAIGVTTTDTDRIEAGYFVSPPGVIRPTTPNRAIELQLAFNRGTAGSANEAGLEAMYLALTEPRLSGPNAGFYRPNAWLAAVIVSDEEDYSQRTIAFYSNFLDNLKSPIARSVITFNGILGPEPNGCSGMGGIADPGSRYWALIRATDGIGGSICESDAVTVLDDLGGANFGLEFVFPLTSPVGNSALTVMVDGVTIPPQNAWAYSPAANAIVFTAASVPQPGASVDVTYSVSCGP